MRMRHCSAMSFINGGRGAFTSTCLGIHVSCSADLACGRKLSVLHCPSGAQLWCPARVTFHHLLLGGLYACGQPLRDTHFDGHTERTLADIRCTQHHPHHHHCAASAGLILRMGARALRRPSKTPPGATRQTQEPCARETNLLLSKPASGRCSPLEQSQATGDAPMRLRT